MFSLSACTFFDDTSTAKAREEYLGWYCEADFEAGDQWLCSKRLLSGALPIGEIPIKEVPRDDGPIAESPPAEKSLFESAAEEIAQQSVGPVVDKDFDISADGYTVQLGAYLSQTVAEQFAGDIVIGNGQLLVQGIVVAGQNRFVIVYGQYQTRQQARTSAERIADLNPQLDYWVRSIESLRNSL